MRLSTGTIIRSIVVADMCPFSRVVILHDNAYSFISELVVTCYRIRQTVCCFTLFFLRTVTSPFPFTNRFSLPDPSRERFFHLYYRQFGERIQGSLRADADYLQPVVQDGLLRVRGRRDASLSSVGDSDHRDLQGRPDALHVLLGREGRDLE